MKCKQVSLISCLLIFLLATVVVANTQQAPPKKQSDKKTPTQNPPAQNPLGKKQPVKNQPQFPNIIDLDNKAASPQQTEKAEKTEAPPAPVPTGPTAQQTEMLVRAVESLTNEMRGLVVEMRALNIRQQAQLDVLRLTRSDARVDVYEREYKTTHDRIVQLETDEQNLQMLIKPESLLAQTRSVGTVDRNETIRQLKAAHEAKLQAVTAEKEALQKREGELVLILEGYRLSNNDAERRIRLTEELLRQLATPIEQKKEATETIKQSPLPLERQP